MMSELKKDIITSLKAALEKRKKVRKEMTMLGRAFDTITMILASILVIILFISEFSFGRFVIGFYFLILIVIIIIPFSLIESKIYKSALNKYKAKLKETRLHYCMYCGGKLDSIQTICPHCGKIFDKSTRIIPQTAEFEKEIQKEYEKMGHPVLEQIEIFNQSRKSNWKFILKTYVCIVIGFGILIGLISQDLMFTITFMLAFPLLMLVIIGYIGFIMNAMFIYSRVVLSTQSFQLYIEKKLFFQINWSDLEKMEIYRVRFHGSYITFNYQHWFSANVEIISLKYCDFSKKKQKEIIKSLLQFSNMLGINISVLKTALPIVDEVGEKDLYEQIYNFARAQRFVFHKSIE